MTFNVVEIMFIYIKYNITIFLIIFSVFWYLNISELKIKTQFIDTYNLNPLITRSKLFLY